MKGRKQTTSASPGGRSLSTPIQECGQSSRSRPQAEADAGVATGFTRAVFALKIVRTMELITILNHSHRHRGFVYQHARFTADRLSIEVEVRPRAGSAAICSGCNQPAPGYDHLPQRRFEFIPLWGFLVFLLYRMRRVECRNCGVLVEEVPWCDGKHQLTRAYMLFLAR